MATEETLSMKAMETALTSVLRDMAATPAELVDCPAPPRFERSLTHAHITFSGPCSGELGLLMDPDLTSEIACRILGTDGAEPLLQEMILDAAKELLNVVCGQFLTLRFGDEPVFSLGVPRVFPLSAQACNLLVSGAPILVFRSGRHVLPAYVRVKGDTR